MSQIISKTVVKLMISSYHKEMISAVITSFFLFGVKCQLLTIFPIFRVIKLKFGGGVNSETLMSYFMSILPSRMK